MNPTARQMLELTVTAAVFGLVLALWLIGTLLWFRRRARRVARVGQRLGLEGSTQAPERTLRLWHQGQSVATAVPDFSAPRGLFAALDRTLEQAGWKAQAPAVFGGMLALTLVLTAVSILLLHGPLPGLGISIAAMLVFWIVLRYRVNRQVVLFEQQFVDALDLAAQSLRAGHPLSGAFRFISEEIAAPVGPLFGEVCQQQDLGVGLEEALYRIARASPSADLRVFVAAVVIQMRSGGNLADMMHRIADVIRDRMRLNRRVRVLTAQTQFSKRVLLVLPVIIFFLLNLINPKYMHMLYGTFTGQCLMAAAVVSMVFGAWVMNRIANLQY
jgi:tight adherence protein B